MKSLLLQFNHRLCHKIATSHMGRNFRVLLFAFLLLPLVAHGQMRGAGEFQITKITKSLTSAPQFTYSGAQWA